MTTTLTQEQLNTVASMSPKVLDLIILAFQAGWYTNAAGLNLKKLDKSREADWSLFLQNPDDYLRDMKALSVDAGAAFNGDPAWDPEILTTYTGPTLVKG